MLCDSEGIHVFDTVELNQSDFSVDIIRFDYLFDTWSWFQKVFSDEDLL